jgi:hypothetical protein
MECGAGQFLDRFAVRAAPFALPAGRGSVFCAVGFSIDIACETAYF